MRKQPEISREALFERLEYKPHSKEQWNVHRSNARFRIACCGRKWGKSTCFGHEATLRMFIPDSMHWICGPTYRLGEKEFRVVFDDFKRLKLLDHCRKSYNVNQGMMRIHFQDLNSIIEVVSAEKQDSLVGEGLDSVIMSEAALHKQSTWSQFIEPNLAATKGSADFPSTPRGFNWFKGLYDIGQLPGGMWEEYDSWRLPTWTNAAMFPGGFDDPELVRIRQNVSEMHWLQEYAAEFTAFEGMIYSEFNEAFHVKRINYNPAWRNWWALDFGFTDPFCCYDIMIDPSDNVYIWREYQVTNMSTTDHGITLKNRDNPDGFHVDNIAADPRGADEIATLTWMLGPILANAVGWSLGVEAIKRQMKPAPDGTPRFLIDPSCIHLIRQLKALRAPNVREGHNSKTGQHDYDDHGPDAIRYFFNEYFVLGAGHHLSDVYSGAPSGSEAAGFFTYKTGIKLDSRIPF
jgi:hypothetical protein